MEDTLEEKLQQVIWTAHSLFDRGKVSGSTANISFRHEDEIYISGSGTCFGTLREADFAVTDLEGNHRAGKKPSKELPIHQTLYQKKEVGAVIHVHSFYATLWSCLAHPDPRDVIPAYTPYLRMKLGTVGTVPYAPPGSEELFTLFRECVERSDGYLLQNHGLVVGAPNMMEAFYAAEELEESAKIAWYLRREKDRSPRCDML